MKHSTLKQRHKQYNGECWRDYWALYKGGLEFHSRIHRFLPRTGREKDDTYQEKCEAAHYTCYLGPIVDYFGAYLFSSDSQYKATSAGREATAPDFYAELAKDADGTGQDLKTWLQDRWKQSVVKGASYWMLDFPQVTSENAPATRDEWEKNGFGDIKLRPFEREQLVDWKRDDRGRFVWAIFYEETCERENPGDDQPMVTARWWIIDRERVVHRALQWPDRQPPKEDEIVPVVWQVDHNLGEVPIVELLPPVGLWIGDRISSPQREHFCIASAQNWNIRQSCYAMPLFKVKDPSAGPEVMGAGYYYICAIDEDMEWVGPPTDVFTATQNELKGKKDEIYRVVTQMAQGVDNNAAAVGRSGESKLADAKAEEIILTGYGSALREAEERTLTLLSRSRDDKLEWQVTGRDVFRTIDPLTLIEIGQDATLLGIRSQTFQKELRVRIASGVLPGLPDETRKKIADEIMSEVDEQHEHQEILDEAIRRAQEDAEVAARGGGAEDAGGGTGKPLPGRGNGKEPARATGGPLNKPGARPAARSPAAAR